MKTFKKTTAVFVLDNGDRYTNFYENQNEIIGNMIHEELILIHGYETCVILPKNKIVKVMLETKKYEK